MNTESELRDLMSNVLNEYFNEDEYVADIRTFEDAMLLTSNTGLVLRFDDAEFQVQIIRSK